MRRVVVEFHSAHTVGVTTEHSLSFVAWPLIALGAVGVLVLVLRWAYSPGHSLIERRAQDGAPDEYGALVDVSAPSTFIVGEQQRRQLEASGIRATLARTTKGPRVMVFPEDAKTARAILANPPTTSR